MKHKRLFKTGGGERGHPCHAATQVGIRPLGGLPKKKLGYFEGISQKIPAFAPEPIPKPRWDSPCLRSDTPFPPGVRKVKKKLGELGEEIAQEKHNTSMTSQAQHKRDLTHPTIQGRDLAEGDHLHN